MAFRLRETVYFCTVDRRTVFLDVEADRYFCLPYHTDFAFQALVEGEEIAGLARDALSPLLSSGILIESEDLPYSKIESTTIPPAREAGFPTDRRPTVSAITLAIICQIWASHCLKRRRFSAIIDRLRARKAHILDARPASLAPAIAELAIAFGRTALMLRTADLCLPRAIAFTMASHARGIAPTIVFGVQLNPFCAHCWVQMEDQIILDDLGQASLFTTTLDV